MTTEQAYFFTVALINLVLAFSGTRVQDPEGKEKSIKFFIIAFATNFVSWFLYVFDLNTFFKIVSVLLSSAFIWGLVVFSYKRCEQPFPLRLIATLFVINSLALGYFTYVGNFNGALHVSAFFVPLAFCIIGYLFLKAKKQSNPSDKIFAYACLIMGAGVASRSVLLELAPDLFSATIISSQIIWPAFSVISGVFALLSFTEEVQCKLLQESNTDQLTGLANRRRMERVLSQEWARADRHQRPLSIIMLDIDFFKKYNDNLGHQAGDRCLKKVAHIISQKTQRGGELAVRYGGEEFLLILPDTDTTKAHYLANEIRKAITDLSIPHPHSPICNVTISAGVAVFQNGNYKNINTLLRAADLALYQAKQNGRNQVQTVLTPEEQGIVAV